VENFFKIHEITPFRDWKSYLDLFLKKRNFLFPVPKGWKISLKFIKLLLLEIRRVV
jgi:hypothetical protein